MIKTDFEAINSCRYTHNFNITNALVGIGSIAAVALAIIAICVIVPEFSTKTIDTIIRGHGWQHVTKTVIDMSGEALIKNTAILSVAGIVLGIGVIGFLSLGKKTLQVTHERLSIKLDKGEIKDESLKRNVENLVNKMNKVRFKSSQLLLLAGTVTFIAGIILLALPLSVFSVNAGILIEGSIAQINPLLLKLLLGSLIAGSTISTVGILSTVYGMINFVKSKNIALRAINDDVYDIEETIPTYINYLKIEKSVL